MVPAIGVFEGEILVQRTDLSVDEEILLLLHYAGEQGFSRTMIGRAARWSPAAVTRALQKTRRADLERSYSASQWELSVDGFGIETSPRAIGRQT